jgi:hypothetical protein
VAVFAELISGGNVLVTGVESLPSLGLVVTAAGMMAVVVAEMAVVVEWDDGSNTQVEVYAQVQVQVDLYFPCFRW